MKILYFARLREVLGVSGEDLALPSQVHSVGDLRAYLAMRGEVWSALVATRNVRAAVNQVMADDRAAIVDADEVAFFPPVTGG